MLYVYNKLKLIISHSLLIYQYATRPPVFANYDESYNRTSGKSTFNMYAGLS